MSPAVQTAFTPMMAELVSAQKLTEKERLLTLRLAEGRSLGHVPGQFVEVSVFGTGEAPISISSPPAQTDTFEVCVRNVGSVTHDLHQIEPGVTLGVRGPYGHGFDVKEFEGKDVIFVAGGLGLAPLRSMVKTVLWPELRSRFGRVIVLYGAKTPMELLYTDELRAWQERSDVECLVTVDRPDEAWRGNVGVITTLFKKIQNLDAPKTVVAVCGPPIMYKFVLLELLMHGIPESQIKLSLERRMKCGIGKCGHCQIDHLYACQDGPVFTYSDIKHVREAIH